MNSHREEPKKTLKVGDFSKIGSSLNFKVVALACHKTVVFLLLPQNMGTVG